MIIACIHAEAFLIHAVSVAGIDWCIGRLQQAKKQKFQLERIIDLVLPAEAQCRPRDGK